MWSQLILSIFVITFLLELFYGGFPKDKIGEAWNKIKEQKLEEEV